jgi:hypothetical protein
MYIPDGQLLNHHVTIHVSNEKIEMNEEPRLHLARLSADGGTKGAALKEWRPFLVASGQTWTQKIEGQTIAREGTILMFALEGFTLPKYQSTTRVIPQLSWKPPAGVPERTLLAEPVYLGSYWGAFIWTIVIVGLLVFFVGRLAHKTEVLKTKESGVLYLISGNDGYMSLWRTQLAAWSVAVGSMVVFFGLIQLAVPSIPDSLVALMGMSVATGSLSAIAGKRPQKDPSVAKAHSPPPNPDGPRWRHLIGSWNSENKQVVLSVQKAQMVFWTGIILALFVVKSLGSGELWSVPWEMVTLTGVSQLGYLSDKALQHPKNPEKDSSP